jgi:FlaA1/EpsC-like NDP-sugar epimerase
MKLILQALAQKQNNTQFTMVRFGNVLGSSGSVIPLFTKQIKNINSTNIKLQL